MKQTNVRNVSAHLLGPSVFPWAFNHHELGARLAHISVDPCILHCGVVFLEDVL